MVLQEQPNKDSDDATDSVPVRVDDAKHEESKPNSINEAPINADATPKLTPLSAVPTIDIEHVPVENDPRKWSATRKNLSLALIASASMIAGLAGSVQNPAVREMEVDLPATSSQFSWSISLFILIQGLMPLVWSAVSEIKGRRLVYLASLSVFTIGSIVAAVSNSIGLVIGFRCFQAAGSSAVIAIGAATLADIFDPFERGTKMGIYYIAPLLGPALGPIFGGVLTTGFNWRAIFWFLTMVSGASLLSFMLFFRDTFRRERSLIYQNAICKKRKDRPARLEMKDVSDEKGSGMEKNEVEEKDVEKAVETNVEAKEIKLSLTDVNPIKPIGLVLRRTNNLLTLFASGILFAFSFLIQYTVSRTLSTYYHFEALKIGLVSLSFGFGCVTGSILGGRWSDYYLARLKRKNKGVSYPEMRLPSTLPGILTLPPCTLAFGWVCQQRVHVSAICIFLFLCGFMTVWIYSSTLAYIVDANNGRSSTAVATNSAFRGLSAFVAIEIAVPMQDGLGDGWTYTIWAGIMALSGVLLLLVQWKGQQWREKAETREMGAEPAPVGV